MKNEGFDAEYLKKLHERNSTKDIEGDMSRGTAAEILREVASTGDAGGPPRSSAYNIGRALFRILSNTVGDEWGERAVLEELTRGYTTVHELRRRKQK